ncbi:uncharacterized protein [Coffea arabica]|uniref:Myb-like protein X n=1 Tax=Coffea arabica TaxID=13443 RepID=A0A6P6WN58_COFAR
MSRCFPFPPPGYEKKPRLEDSSVLKEEKQKEKRQKKEKKEKEKREGKEKKDKERSDGKHRDKKDKKEKNKERKDKHREKKKEKCKDKDKSSTSETSRVTGIPEAKGVEKLNAGDGKIDRYSAEEKNHPAQFHGHNGGRSVESNLVASRAEESELVPQLDKSIRVEQKSIGDELVEKFSGLDKKRDDEAHRFAARNPGNLAEEKGKSSDKQFDNKKMEGRGTFSGNSVVYNLSKTTEGKVEGIPKVVEKNDERRLGEKEKTKERGNDKRGDKHKDKDRDKKSHGKDKDKEKERKKKKEKDTIGHKKNDQDKAEDGRSGIIGVIDSRSSSLSSDLQKNANVEGNPKKRKDVGINGFLHDTEVRPHKLQRPTSHQVVENGRKLEACQIQSLLTSDRQPNAAILKVDEKEGRKNGIIESLPLPAKPKSSAAAADVDEITAVLRKPPHPDSKYLSKVLSVPKMDEWSEFDDQEWLFASQAPRNPKKGGSAVGEELQVWSKALHIESADAVALPYVIPY